MKNTVKILSALLLLTALPGLAQTDFCHRARQSRPIDVRTPGEYAAGHIDGALNLPLERLITNIGAISDLPRQSQLLVYCRSGNRSAQAMAILARQGYTNVTDGGGISTLATRLQACNKSR